MDIPVFRTSTPLPSIEQVFALWQRYNMPNNIRNHSIAVCQVALQVTDWLEESGVSLHREAVRMGALLHDLAKGCCLNTDRAHDLVGKEFLEREGYAELGYLVGVHVYLPSSHPLDESVVVFYADKRVMHDQLVTLSERFDDLVNRYGNGDKHRIDVILQGRHRAEQVERQLWDVVGKDRPLRVDLAKGLSFDARLRP